MLSEEKKRGLLRPQEEIQDRPRATKVLKYLYQATFAWKTKGLWMTRDENHPQNCQTQASSLCTVSSLLHWQRIKLLPSVGRWLGLGGRRLSEEDMRRLLGHRGFDMHPYCKGLYHREGSPSWGSPSVHNLINVVVLSIGKYLIYLVPTGRSWVQFWVENIFDCNSPCETSLREWTHRQYQDLQTELCAKAAGPFDAQWTSGCTCKWVFPSSGTYICCLRCWVFATLFWPMDLCCSKSDDVPSGSCLVFLSKQTWYGGWMQS